MSDTVPLFHRDLGGANEAPLVILHGLLGSSRNWQTAGRDLADRWRVFALDLRNHGQSPHADDMGYDAMVGDVVRWLDAREFAQVTLMGHSMGGKVAMALACRHPERVRQLVVVDIAPKNYHSYSHRAEFAAMTELRLDTLRSRAEAELRFEARVDDWAMRKFLATNLERGDDGQWRWAINLPALTAALPELERNPLSDGERFAGPALFIAGGKSRYIEAGDAAVIDAHFAHAQLHTMPGSGHNPHIEKRPEFTGLIRAIL